MVDGEKQTTPETAQQQETGEKTGDVKASATAEPKAAAQDAAKELEELKAALKEQQNKYLYLYADFENYKKRVIKERSDLIKFGHEGLSRELLGVGDNLDRALEHTENREALVNGIRMVRQQLQEALGRFGVQVIEALGEKFDPQLHEAVGQEAISGATNGHEPGTVIREHQKGYMLNGRLLRPSRVIVATK